jgi:hypothetical protein
MTSKFGYQEVESCVSIRHIHFYPIFVVCRLCLYEKFECGIAFGIGSPVIGLHPEWISGSEVQCYINAYYRFNVN